MRLQNFPRVSRFHTLTYLILQTVVPVSDDVQPFPSFYAPIVASQTIVDLRTMLCPDSTSPSTSLILWTKLQILLDKWIDQYYNQCLTLIVTGHVPIFGSTPYWCYVISFLFLGGFCLIDYLLAYLLVTCSSYYGHKTSKSNSYSLFVTCYALGVPNSCFQNISVCYYAKTKS